MASSSLAQLVERSAFMLSLTLPKCRGFEPRVRSFFRHDNFISVLFLVVTTFDKSCHYIFKPVKLTGMTFTIAQCRGKLQVSLMIRLQAT